MSSYSILTLLFLFAALIVSSCTNTNSVSLEEHIATVEAEDVSEIKFRPHQFVGGQEAFFSELRYPDSARQRGVEGTVLLNFTVTEQGLPENIEVAQTSGNRALDESAVRTMERMRFIPGVSNGERAAINATFPVIFRLN